VVPGSKWHPAADQLRGDVEYGKPNDKSNSWSIKFNEMTFNQFLFTSGDYTKWVISSKSELLNSGFFSNEQKMVLRTSSSTGSVSFVNWYFR
jgi:hypothetical protein